MRIKSDFVEARESKFLFFYKSTTRSLSPGRTWWLEKSPSTVRLRWLCKIHLEGKWWCGSEVSSGIWVNFFPMTCWTMAISLKHNRDNWVQISAVCWQHILVFITLLKIQSSFPPTIASWQWAVPRVLNLREVTQVSDLHLRRGNWNSEKKKKRRRTRFPHLLVRKLVEKIKYRWQICGLYLLQL